MDYTIDTIFYFVGTEAEYQRMRENISPKTIVFVQDSHEIYLNGWAYGKTSTNGLATTQDVNNLVDATTAINSRIDSVSASLGALQNSLDLDILNSVQDALQDGEAIRNNAIINGLINQKIGEWSSLASLVTENSETWSNLIQNVDGISGTVSNIMHNFDDNGDVQISLATMDAGVRGSAAFTSLQSKWALVDNNEQLLRWMAGGFASEASQNTSFANVYSSFKNATENGISALLTSVENIGNVYVAKSSLVSEIENKKAQIISTAGLATEVYADNAASQIFSRIVGETGETVSSLLTQASADHGEIALLSQTVSAQGTTIAGLATTSSLNSAIASLEASMLDTNDVDTRVSAGIHVAVTAQDGEIKNAISTATIAANQINLEGLVTANNNFKIMSDGSMETIAGKIGGFVIGEHSLKATVNSVDKIVLHDDGSGSLASGNFVWNANGDVTMTADTLSINNSIVISLAGYSTAVEHDSIHVTSGAGTTTTRITNFGILVASKDFTNDADTILTWQGVRIKPQGLEFRSTVNGLGNDTLYVTYEGIKLYNETNRSSYLRFVSGGVEYDFDVAAAITAGILVQVQNNA